MSKGYLQKGLSFSFLWAGSARVAFIWDYLFDLTTLEIYLACYIAGLMGYFYGVYTKKRLLISSWSHNEVLSGFVISFISIFVILIFNFLLSYFLGTLLTTI